MYNNKAHFCLICTDYWFAINSDTMRGKTQTIKIQMFSLKIIGQCNDICRY
jgi:hypothetical protein